jgi:Ni,Fe-hydrogenase III large subunit
MSTTKADIIPVEKTTTYEIDAFQVQVRTLELFKSVTLLVIFLDNSNQPRDSKIIKLEGEDYLAWNNDDEYIITKVAQICGFTLKPTAN